MYDCIGYTDLLRLLQQFDVDEHVCTFEEHKVYDIDTFKELTTDDFKEMGITLMGDIVKLQKALAKGIYNMPKISNGINSYNIIL